MTRATLLPCVAYPLAMSLLSFVSLAQQAPLNPRLGVPIEAQCYYHDRSLLLECIQGSVPNCGAASMSYDACDCTKTVSLTDGIDTIFVLDQLPYRTTPTKSLSVQIWNDYLAALGSVLGKVLGTSSNNRVGVIRAIPSGCDFFGFTADQVLRPAAAFAADATTRYSYTDLGVCTLHLDDTGLKCNRKQVRHLGCVNVAQTILRNGPASRWKNIISLRHTQGYPRTGNFENIPSIRLSYIFITTANPPETGDFDPIKLITNPTFNFRRTEFDYGGFNRNNADFIVRASGQRIVAATLAANPAGFVSCADPTFVSSMQGSILPEAFAVIAPMTCTFWPRGPRLTWVALPTRGVVRESIPVVTSWLCQLGSTATLSPTSPPTSVPPTTSPPTTSPPTTSPPTTSPPTSLPPTSVPPTSSPPTLPPVVNVIEHADIFSDYDFVGSSSNVFGGLNPPLVLSVDSATTERFATISYSATGWCEGTVSQLYHFVTAVKVSETGAEAINVGRMISGNTQYFGNSNSARLVLRANAAYSFELVYRTPCPEPYFIGRLHDWGEVRLSIVVQ